MRSFGYLFVKFFGVGIHVSQLESLRFHGHKTWWDLEWEPRLRSQDSWCFFDFLLWWSRSLFSIEYSVFSGFPHGMIYIQYIYIYIHVPGTLNNHILMDVWWNNNFLCNDWESSNWFPTKKNWLFGVPGLCIYSVVIWSPVILMFYLLFRTLPFIDDDYFLFESNMAESPLKWLTQTPTKTNALHELSWHHITPRLSGKDCGNVIRKVHQRCKILSQ